ncbi:ribonuclease HII [Anaerosalibacter bizertensis]|uniref:Ribonuclease n=1 Tax=Anaerosalibacter bizertensis TaxID=932217 RepID=A0A844FIJ1_9FIRM|nr:ribonuclease HII [Anaerosalibacter bizertensis]MBV1816569.1 ribonuclease HII [Bacteroidales bacterium MSK.15.36]HHV27217.1 ribonuclease HII [Tissierellia bacterium]MBU5293315.1 ribonuclease HII [Anaerosalibacter bizertensis]MCB5558627.1 ribonuclease HII [Anaerosalibacter bizertensis]MCG4563956.1 ribonuclease HII [Anaerosalibacter bizertensis]
MLEIENEIRSKGYKYIACIDEVGRGCLAGDVVACAIIMPKDLIIEGVKDSKKLTPRKREKLYGEILESSLALGFGQVDSKTIDKINIKESTRLAMKKAVLNLKDRDGNSISPDFILIDAEEIYLDIPQKGIIKGDARSHGIACASIMAKVFRDRQCEEIWGKKYSGYLIEKNKGYGTKEHREAIKKLGPSPIHRLTFLKNII